jgi:hypothetical protein
VRREWEFLKTWLKFTANKMKLFSKIRYILSLPSKVKELEKIVGHLQPVGKFGEIQRLFNFNCH